MLGIPVENKVLLMESRHGIKIWAVIAKKLVIFARILIFCQTDQTTCIEMQD